MENPDSLPTKPTKDNIAMLSLSLLGIVVAVCMYHLVVNSTPELWMTRILPLYGMMVVAVLFPPLTSIIKMFFAGRASELAAQSGEAEPPLSQVFGTIAIYFVRVMLLLPLSIIIYSMGMALMDSANWAMEPKQIASKFPVAIAVLAAGVILFLFRLKLRTVYGFSEIIAGVAVACFRPLSADGLDLYLTLLTASVYLIVRGLDNIHQGLDKDPVAKWLGGSSSPKRVG